MRLAVLLPIVYLLFATFFVSCRPKPRQPQFPIMSQRGNHPRNEPGPTKSGALCDAPPTKAPEIIPVGFVLLPGNIRLHTHEGVRALDDAIRFLYRAKPEPPLALSPGLCLAAADQLSRAGWRCNGTLRQTMAAIPGSNESLWRGKPGLGGETLRMVAILRVKLCWR